MVVRALLAAARFGPEGTSPLSRFRLVLLVAATVVPLATYVTINEAELGQAFGIPIERQVNTKVDPIQRAALAANHRSLFGANFLPPTVLQAVRPDAIGTTRAFPFLSVPRRPPVVVGDVVFDKLQRSLSAPSSMPLLCVLCVIGLGALIHGRRLRPLLGSSPARPRVFGAARRSRS